jgi:hypothetical protein
MELPGESPFGGYSEISLMPETELALVAAEDWADGRCCEVLAVSSDSRLFRYKS